MHGSPCVKQASTRADGPDRLAAQRCMPRPRSCASLRPESGARRVARWAPCPLGACPPLVDGVDTPQRAAQRADSCCPRTIWLSKPTHSLHPGGTLHHGHPLAIQVLPRVANPSPLPRPPSPEPPARPSPPLRTTGSGRQAAWWRRLPHPPDVRQRPVPQQAGAAACWAKARGAHAGAREASARACLLDRWAAAAGCGRSWQVLVRPPEADCVPPRICPPCRPTLCSAWMWQRRASWRLAAAPPTA